MVTTRTLYLEPRRSCMPTGMKACTGSCPEDAYTDRRVDVYVFGRRTCFVLFSLGRAQENDAILCHFILKHFASIEPECEESLDPLSISGVLRSDDCLEENVSMCLSACSEYFFFFFLLGCSPRAYRLVSTSCGFTTILLGDVFSKCISVRPRRIYAMCMDTFFFLLS